MARAVTGWLGGEAAAATDWLGRVFGQVGMLALDEYRAALAAVEPDKGAAVAQAVGKGDVGHGGEEWRKNTGW